MEHRHFKHAHYIGPEEKCHLAASVLQSEAPRVKHDHDYFELFLITSGQCLHRVNDATQELSQGHLVFIRPTDTHNFQSISVRLCHLTNLVILPAQIDKYFQQYRSDVENRFFWSNNKLPDVHMFAGPAFDSIIENLRALEIERQSQLLLDKCLTSVFSWLCQNQNDTHPHMPNWMREACDKVLEPEYFRLGAAGFVQAAGRGHEHVCRSAKKYLGQAPSSYVNNIRLNYAARRLSHSEISIMEIALECGIENIGHFYKLFQKRFDMTPRQYRLLRQRDVVQPKN